MKADYVRECMIAGGVTSPLLITFNCPMCENVVNSTDEATFSQGSVDFNKIVAFSLVDRFSTVSIRV